MTERNGLMALEKELEAYKKALPNLLSQEGKFVLIFQEKIIDTFTSYEDAIKEGYKVAKLEPFLVKKIQAVEDMQKIVDANEKLVKGLKDRSK